jgi:hypothetical protein
LLMSQLFIITQLFPFKALSVYKPLKIILWNQDEYGSLFRYLELSGVAVCSIWK